MGRMAIEQTAKSTGNPSRRAPVKLRSARNLVTPEGVPITFRLADLGDRAGAFLVDLLIIIVAVVSVILLFLWASSDGMEDLLESLVLVFMFVARNFYFAFFELRWGGTTPGKKIFKIRVVDRGGGHLTADAVFARNFMREVELFVPAMVLIYATIADVGAAFVLGMLTWLFIIVLLPMFNKDRMRAGDLIAGTLVVSVPKSVLLRDIGATPIEGAQTQTRDEDVTPSGKYSFTTDQLEQYGIYELQTLEGILRRKDGPQAAETKLEVADRIRRKIGWIEPENAETNGSPDRFLEEFYAALRARLEQRMLFGDRREDKHYQKNKSNPRR
jgi:uncharacterized RDD family membrane protein YckC